MKYSSADKKLKDFAHRQAQKHSDFSEEYVLKDVVIALHNNHVVSGRVAEARRFWIKVVLQDNSVLYINKAWVVYIEPKK